MPPHISALSTEYLRCSVNGRAAGAAIDPTAGTVEVAFLTADAAPIEGDWKAATWDTDGVNRWAAQVLVGPAGVFTLVRGRRYALWVRITLGSEIIVRQSGTVVVGT